MKDEIKDKIIEIYEKLLKIDDDIITVNSSLSYVDSFSTNAIKLENERDFLYEKFKDLKSELASLKAQLSEAGEVNKLTDKDIHEAAIKHLPTKSPPETILEADENLAQELRRNTFEMGAKWARDWQLR